jgi:hypothetical protein
LARLREHHNLMEALGVKGAALVVEAEAEAMAEAMAEALAVTEVDGAEAMAGTEVDEVEAMAVPNVTRLIHGEQSPGKQAALITPANFLSRAGAG